MQQRIKSYVLRAGRMSPRQQQGLDCWLKNYLMPAPEKLWDFASIFDRKADTVVEIGFGMGASLLNMAQAHPEINFIGIEVHRAGIGSLAADLHDAGLSNVRIAPWDAALIFDTCLPSSSLSGVQIFFPDPWPKKRHHKRRLIQREFIHRVTRTLQPQGFIHCATDWEEYALHMMHVLSLIPELHNQDVAGGFIPRPDTRPLTKFEQRGTRLGHGVWDLIFIK